MKKLTWWFRIVGAFYLLLGVAEYVRHLRQPCVLCG